MTSLGENLSFLGSSFLVCVTGVADQSRSQSPFLRKQKTRQINGIVPPGNRRRGIIISVWAGLVLRLFSCTANIISIVGRSYFLGMTPLWIIGKEEALVALLVSCINYHKCLCVYIRLSRALPVLLRYKLFSALLVPFGVMQGTWWDEGEPDQTSTLLRNQFFLIGKVLMGHCQYKLQGHLCKNLFLADPGSD